MAMTGPSISTEGPVGGTSAAYVPNTHRSGLALCLSGGGFRAALFHLGALRRLNELGILGRLDAITAVSGGSLVAAHLAERIVSWPAPGQPIADWDKNIAVPFQAFTGRNLRTWPLLQQVLFPWNWFRPSAAVRALAAAYQQRLVQKHLGQLPSRPRIVFCATDMTFGVDWIVERARLGDYQAGYAAPPASWPVARAAAASSCFPPFFGPLPVGLRPNDLKHGRVPAGPERDAWIRGLTLTDGGVYDNLGLEPVWKTAALVLVSDGGSLFQFQTARTLTQDLARYLAIIENQAEAVRKRWLISNFVAGQLSGTYWGVASAAADYGAGAPAGYSNALVKEVIAPIRTDLDAFSAGEQAVLENHGYLLAEAAIRRHVPSLVPQPAPPLAVPHPDWLDETRVRGALRRSNRRSWLGRF
jgi:NTE family protein